VNWKIKFSKRAEKYYLRLSASERKKIKNTLLNISVLDFPPTHKDVIPLLVNLTVFLD